MCPFSVCFTQLSTFHFSAFYEHVTRMTQYNHFTVSESVWLSGYCTSLPPRKSEFNPDEGQIM